MPPNLPKSSSHQNALELAVAFILQNTDLIKDSMKVLGLILLAYVFYKIGKISVS